MHCLEFRTLFSDYLDGALDDVTSEGARAHLAACPACCRAVRAYREGTAALRAAPVEAAPRDLTARIVNAVRRDCPSPARSGFRGAPGAALAAVLVLVLVADLTDHGRGALEALVPIHDAMLAAVEQRLPHTDLLTVRLRDASVDGVERDPYAALASFHTLPVPDLRVEVPAVWTGR